MVKWKKTWERWLVRLMALGVIALGYLGFRFSADCPATGCPAYALSNPWILKGERAGVLVLGTVIILTVLWRMIWHGRLPDQVGRDGMTWWRETVEDVNESVADLNESMKLLNDDFIALRKEFEEFKKDKGT